MFIEGSWRHGERGRGIYLSTASAKNPLIFYAYGLQSDYLDMVCENTIEDEAYVATFRLRIFTSRQLVWKALRRPETSFISRIGVCRI